MSDSPEMPGPGYDAQTRPVEPCLESGLLARTPVQGHDHPRGIPAMNDWKCADCNNSNNDALDGAALRRLREALPEGTHVALVEWPEEWNAGVMRDGSPPSPVVTATGPTIAEAADKCRKALG